MEAAIVMHGRLRAPELPVYGTKTIAIREGALELHGRVKVLILCIHDIISYMNEKQLVFNYVNVLQT